MHKFKLKFSSTLICTKETHCIVLKIGIQLVHIIPELLKELLFEYKQNHLLCNDNLF